MLGQLTYIIVHTLMTFLAQMLKKVMWRWR